MHGDPIEGRHEEADICVKPSLLSCYLVLTLQATAINSNLKAVNAHWFVWYIAVLGMFWGPFNILANIDEPLEDRRIS